MDHYVLLLLSGLMVYVAKSDEKRKLRKTQRSRCLCVQPFVFSLVPSHTTAGHFTPFEIQLLYPIRSSFLQRHIEPEKSTIYRMKPLMTFSSYRNRFSRR